MAQITKPIILDETGQEIVDAIEALTSKNYNDLTNKPVINNVEVNGILTDSDLNLQTKLVSGINIKTINNIPVLGSGNIPIDIDEVHQRLDALTASKEDRLNGAKLDAVNSGITYDKVSRYDAYRAEINANTSDIEDIQLALQEVPGSIDTKINSIGSGSVLPTSNQAISGISVGISANNLVVTASKVNIPTSTNDLINTAGFQTSSQVNTLISTALANKINENVVLHTTGNNLSYNGDTVTLNTTYKNLNTGTVSTKDETIHLANSTTAGLMSPSDVNTLSDHGTRISALEGTTNRVLYVINSTLGPIGSYPVAFTIKGVVYSIEGSTITEHNGASPEPTYTMDAQGNVTIHGIAYTFDVANMHGERLATQANIGQFAINEGFVAPFRGVAIVVEETFHIWRYYTNTEGGVIIGWKDDGQDTVSAFTNTTPGIIQGSATDGKVYAENDGTGSVYGWSSLTSRVTAVENRPTNVMTFTSGTTLPSSGELGQIFMNTSTHKIYIYNGISFEAMNTYQ